MPPRISRSSLQGSRRPKPQSGPRKPKKAAKRALDAFAIASHDQSDKPKVRSHRLGELEESGPRKRPHNDEESGSDNGDERKRRRQTKAEHDDLSFDEGSDSEGNNWTMGHIDDDEDDSDIDSDEAFGESDEEKFDGWTFRGSSSMDKGKKPKKRQMKSDADIGVVEDFDLSEGDDPDADDIDEDSLGEDAIDLATALDQYEGSDDDKQSKESKKSTKDSSGFDDSEPSEEDDFAADGASDYSSSDSDDESENEIDGEQGRVARLKTLISSLPEDLEEKGKRKGQRDGLEANAPSEFAVTRKIDLMSLKPRTNDPERKKSLKLLQDDSKSSKRSDIARKLDAPLPQRQQDRLDRVAANEKANETLSRWTDTVKQNRRAEHLHFPLQHSTSGPQMGETRLMPTTTAAPMNELESTIQSILQQSGLSNGKDDDEDHFQKWEELQTNKLPLEEVAKRRAELRRQRELLFREEIRAKRVKKIKSKAYRRVHRKERERLMQKERESLKAEGVDISEDEREYNDRRRAEERMGAKHRESKWAKGIKASGRSAWDEDARAGVTEMARRNEELRRRIEGRDIRNEDEDDSDLSPSDDDEGDEDEKDDEEALQKQLGRLKQKNLFSTTPDESGLGKLGSMKFMQRAEAARRALNDEAIEEMRREIAGDVGHSDEADDEDAPRVGRMTFGPGGRPTISPRTTRSEFEERPGSEDEGERQATNAGEIQPRNTGVSILNRPNTEHEKSTKRKSVILQEEEEEDAIDDPFMIKAPRQSKPSSKVEVSQKKRKVKPTPQDQPAVDSKLKSPKGHIKISADSSLPEPTVSTPDIDGWQTVTYEKDFGNKEDVGNEGVDLDISNIARYQDLTAQAFAGDEDADLAEFEREKKAQIKEDAPQETTTTLPGWGAWTGEGLSKRANKRGLKTVTSKSGIEPSKRRDAKLGERVIINQKKVKANSKFLATSLPFPFETREQYERSLRLPKGPEWTTKQTFQDATKPRVMVKQGIIRPLHKPLV